MKIKEKEFRIYNGERPKVLLLGNGICLAHDGKSWNALLDEIKDADIFPLEAKKYDIPMPLKAEMLSNNNLASKMRDIVSKTTNEDKISWNDFVSTTPEMREYIRDLIIGNFDYVLTTNYSYEIEAGILGVDLLSQEDIVKLMNYVEVDNAQTKFLTNTFNLVKGIPIWHIHGEARKPDSMVIGNYYYGKILKRCVERLDGDSRGKKAKESKEDRAGLEKVFRRNIKEKRAQKIGSWIDAFVLGDVHIIGFGLDFSEVDLWWLLEYKNNNKDIAGKTIFYEPKKGEERKCPLDNNKICEHAKEYVPKIECRNLLLDKVYNIKVDNCDFTLHHNGEYKEFYRRILGKI